MTVYHIVLIAFLVSLFVGNKIVCIGLGTIVIILTLINLAHIYGKLD